MEEAKKETAISAKKKLRKIRESEKKKDDEEASVNKAKNDASTVAKKKAE